MPDTTSTLTDWLSAQSRLLQGRVSDPRQDAIGPAHIQAPGWWWEQQAYRQRQTPGLIPPPQDVEALPLGSLSDPVSQAAFLLAPGAMRAGKEALDLLGQPGYSRSFGQGGPLNLLRSQRGNLGPVPRSEYGEALPRSVVRDGKGQLQRLYHGTSRVFPDFDMAQSGTGAGGDLYGPGVYLTDSPQVAGGTGKLPAWHPKHDLGYASAGQPQIKVLADNLSTPEDVWQVLKAQKLGSDTHIDPGVRITQEAGGYRITQMLPDTPNVRPVYADLKRPFAIDGRIAPAQADALLEAVGYDAHEAQALRSQFADINGDRVADGLAGKDLYRILTDHHASKAGVNALLQEQGYDGITHMGGNTSGPVHRVYVSFSSDNVYPAPNVEALR